ERGGGLHPQRVRRGGADRGTGRGAAAGHRPGRRQRDQGRQPRRQAVRRRAGPHRAGGAALGVARGRRAAPVDRCRRRRGDPGGGSRGPRRGAGDRGPPPQPGGQDADGQRRHPAADGGALPRGGRQAL
ncbi:MAG: hypothetical protein AVDCRST_MAG06-1154, partial [uncultured Nocardioides sp.]